MATRTVVCPECDVPLSPGRFACSSCGALVAAVATVSRPFLEVEPVSAVSDEAPSIAPDDDAPLASAFAAPDSTPKAALRKPRIVTPGRRTKPVPASGPVARNGHAAAKVAAVAPEAGVDQPDLGLELELPEANAVAAAPIVPPAATQPVQPTQPTQPAQPTQPVQPAQPAATVPAADPRPVPAWPDRPVWPPQRTIDDVAVQVEVVEPPADRIPAGIYLPPSAVLPPGEALPAVRAEAQAAAAAKAKQSRSFSLTLGEGTGPFGMPGDGPTRVVILGAGIATLGFLLPWADIVIGSGSIGGYLTQWGLAGPGHLLILALVLGLAAVAFAAERLPSWVRLGLPSIAIACILAGLVWPYLVGPFDASIGVYVVAVGAIVMIAGGLLDRIGTRHAEAEASV